MLLMPFFFSIFFLLSSLSALFSSIHSDNLARDCCSGRFVWRLAKNRWNCVPLLLFDAGKIKRGKHLGARVNVHARVRAFAFVFGNRRCIIDQLTAFHEYTRRLGAWNYTLIPSTMDHLFFRQTRNTSCLGFPLRCMLRAVVPCLTSTRFILYLKRFVKLNCIVTWYQNIEQYASPLNTSVSLTLKLLIGLIYFQISLKVRTIRSSRLEVSIPICANARV